MSERVVGQGARGISSRVVLVCGAAWLSCLSLACGFGGEDDVSEEAVGAAAPAPVPAAPPPPAQTLVEEAQAFVCRQEHTQGLTGRHCYVRRHGRNLIIGGPVGTHVTWGTLDYTLSESDHPSRSELRSRYSPEMSLALGPMDAVAVVEYPREPFFEHLGRFCDAEPSTVVATLSLRVERPGELPLDAEWPITVRDVGGVTNLHLSLALDESNGIELPPVTGNAILYDGQCYGGTVGSLSDIRYKATSESRTRHRPCGTYQNSAGERVRFTRTMLDQQVAIVDVRTGRSVRQGLIRASTPACPRSRRSRASTVYSHVESASTREWFERQVARL